MPKKAFITGLSGFLGSSLAAHLLRHGWEVSGSYKEREPKLKDVPARHLDICLPQAWAQALDQARPDVVFHLAACADPDTCAADVAATRQINVQGARFAAQAAAAVGAKIVFTSTDQVHNGSRSLASETDPADPPGVYGRSKFDAEGLVLAEAGASPLVLRLALTYGWGRGAAKGRNFAEKWLRSLLTSNRLAAFTDQYRTPIYGEDACEAMRRGAEEGWQGLLNVAGPERSSRHEFALKLAREFSLPEALVQPASMGDVVFRDPRPPDSSMSIHKLQGLGLRPRGLDAGLKAMHQELETL